MTSAPEVLDPRVPCLSERSARGEREGVRSSHRDRRSAARLRLEAVRSATNDQLFSLTDPALWPAVRQVPLGLPPREYRPSEVTAGPARDSTVAKEIANACGRRVLEASWWIALCPDGSTSCVRDRPSSATHLLFVRRHGETLLWWIR